MNPTFLFKTQTCGVKPTCVKPLGILAGALLLIVGATTSCSTTRGFGRDVQTTGENIERAAAD